VRAYHLDEVFEHSKATYNEIMLRCSTLPPSTSSTIFLFMSPQHLSSSNAGLQTLLKSSEKGTLRQVVLDEVHLHIEHGLSFREEIRKLNDLFFIPVFRPRDTCTFKPRLLCLTGFAMVIGTKCIFQFMSQLIPFFESSTGRKLLPLKIEGKTTLYTVHYLIFEAILERVDL
jgi:hypothetical protein